MLKVKGSEIVETNVKTPQQASLKITNAINEIEAPSLIAADTTLIKVKKETTTSHDLKEKTIESNDSLIKDLKEENRKLLENNNDCKLLIDIVSRSNKNTSFLNATLNSSIHSAKDAHFKGTSHTNELEDAKNEIKRLKECLDKFKALVGSNSSYPKTMISTPQIQISSPTPNLSPSSSSNSAAQKHHRDHQDNEKIHLTNEQQLKKIKSLEESIKELHKSLNNKKQEESALLTDMEITGQAFEDMQVYIEKRSFLDIIYF